MQYRASSQLNDWRHRLWLSMLVAASVAFTLGLACAVPLAAFAAAAALTLSRRAALLLVGAVWLANQIIGYSCLGYPYNANSLAWGAALGAVALLATVAARAVALRVERTGSLMTPLASFAAAFAVYEGALFIVAVVALGDTGSFTPAIMGRIFIINAVAMLGLLVLNRLAIASGLVAAPSPRLSMIETHA